MSGARLARAALAAAGVGLALLLALAPKPWEIASGPGFFAHPGDPLHEVVRRSLWWSAAAAAGLCALLFATAPLWAAPVAAPAAPRERMPRWLPPLLLAAVLLGGVFRFALATGGVWWDEAWLVRRIVVGEVRPEPPLDGAPAEAPRFVPVPWIRTLFEYEKPTNHLPQSAASRAAVDLWRAASGGGPASFDERALRLPTFAASLATIALLGLLVAEWGFPRAGAAAAFLLALHPWHIEIATGARGFAFVGLAAVSGALALARALRTDTLAAWGLYAASQVLLLWTHPFAVYLTACFAGGSLAARGREAARAVVAHVAVAAGVLLVLGPAIAQVPLWHEVHTARPDDAHPRLLLAGQLARELWSNASLGLAGVVPQTDPDRRYPSVDELRRDQPLLRPAVRYVLPGLALAGLVTALVRRGAQRPVVAALAVAPALALAVSASLGHLGRRFHTRYLFFVLALVPPLLAIGVDALASRLGGPRRAAAALAAFVLFTAWLVHPSLANQARHPYAGMKEAVRFADGLPGADRALLAGVGLGGDTARVYQPAILHVERAGDLRLLIARARAESKPLYVLYGHAGQNRKHRVDVFRLLDDPRLFEPLGRFEAVAPEFVYRVLRYTGADLADVAR